MNVEQAIAKGVAEIKSESPRVDSEFLLVAALNKSPTWIKTWPDYQLSSQEKENYLSMIDRRKQGEPVAYITGERGFWTLSLNTNPSTLIPRPETELLVELALDFLNDKVNATSLDLGTGSGAIALAIASERTGDQVWGSDFNEQAVELAKQNAAKNQISNAKFLQSDWLADLPEMKFDLIVSNPPYVAEGDPHLDEGDLVFEPNSALIAADNGLADIKKITKQAKQYLNAGGGLMFEHGFEQGEVVRRIMESDGFKRVTTVNDLSGLERVTKGEWQC